MSSFFCTNYILDINEKPKQKANLSTQIVYGEKIKILNKKNNFYKIKSVHDNYTGYAKKISYKLNLNPTHKIKKLKSRVFTNNKKFLKTKFYLPFNSRIRILNKKNQYVEFEKNKWVKKYDISNIDYKMNFQSITKMFLKCKYLWGGKTFEGIDCSALIQIAYNFNNNFFERDTNKQINFKKGQKNKRNYKLGDLIYWKGHVALCLNSKKLIHAYGPRKKVLIMPINQTIKLIEKTADLKVKKIFSI